MAVTFNGLQAYKLLIAKATGKPKTIRRVTKPMMRGLKVRFAAYPTKINNAERDRIRQWMLDTLRHPLLQGTAFPPLARKIMMYVDGSPLTVTAGTWQIDGANVFLAGPSPMVPPLERVAILATLARLTQLNDDPEIMETVATAMVKGITATVTPVWDGLVIATERPSRMAFNTATYQVAAELNEKWYLPSGQPIEVDKTWTVMDF